MAFRAVFFAAQLLVMSSSLAIAESDDVVLIVTTSGGISQESIVLTAAGDRIYWEHIYLFDGARNKEREGHFPPAGPLMPTAPASDEGRGNCPVPKFTPPAEEPRRQDSPEKDFKQFAPPGFPPVPMALLKDRDEPKKEGVVPGNKEMLLQAFEKCQKKQAAAQVETPADEEFQFSYFVYLISPPNVKALSLSSYEQRLELIRGEDLKPVFDEIRKQGSFGKISDLCELMHSSKGPGSVPALASPHVLTANLIIMGPGEGQAREYLTLRASDAEDFIDWEVRRQTKVVADGRVPGGKGRLLNAFERCIRSPAAKMGPDDQTLFTMLLLHRNVEEFLLPEKLRSAFIEQSDLNAVFDNIEKQLKEKQAAMPQFLERQAWEPAKQGKK